MITAFFAGTKTLSVPVKGKNFICPDCGKPLIQKCGSIRINHFAHPVSTECDSSKFYDGISEWHINWQYSINNPLPGINIEVPICKNEYKKRADLVTSTGLIIEFQKSPLPIEERLNRELHYENLIWIVHTDIQNSKTWKNKSDNPVFFNNILGLYDLSYSFIIPRDRFVRSVINNPHYEIEILSKLIERCKIREEMGKPIWIRSWFFYMDELYTNPFIRLERDCMTFPVLQSAYESDFQKRMKEHFEKYKGHKTAPDLMKLNCFVELSQ